MVDLMRWFCPCVRWLRRRRLGSVQKGPRGTHEVGADQATSAREALNAQLQAFIEEDGSGRAFLGAADDMGSYVELAKRESIEGCLPEAIEVPVAFEIKANGIGDTRNPKLMPLSMVHAGREGVQNGAATASLDRPPRGIDVQDDQATDMVQTMTDLWTHIRPSGRREHVDKPDSAYVQAPVPLHLGVQASEIARPNRHGLGLDTRQTPESLGQRRPTSCMETAVASKNGQEPPQGWPVPSRGMARTSTMRSSDTSAASVTPTKHRGGVPVISVMAPPLPARKSVALVAAEVAALAAHPDTQHAAMQAIMEQEDSASQRQHGQSNHGHERRRSSRHRSHPRSERSKPERRGRSKSTPGSASDSEHEPDVSKTGSRGHRRRRSAPATDEKPGTAVEKEGRRRRRKDGVKKPVRHVLDKAKVYGQPGDGNCLFHSLAFGLNGGSDKGKHTAQRLRRDIAGFIRKNGSKVIAGEKLEDWIKWDQQATVTTYARHIGQSSKWGGGIEMAVCAEMRNSNVDVFQKIAGGRYERISRFDSPIPSRSTISVLYRGGNHYDAIVPC